MKGLKLFLALIIILALSSSAVNSKADGNEWQILTKQNFSSQIRLHPHILVLVSVPWSGESRSLMKELSRLVSDREDEFGNLKLMYMQRNTEKMLSDAIGATDGTTIIYYHHSFPYKYQGRLVAKNIISSILPHISVSPDEIPLKAVNSEEDLKTFLESTDKALLLLDFCGWAHKLLSSKKKNETFEFGFLGDNVRIPEPKGKNQKEAESTSLKCGIQDGFSVIPGLGGFSSVNVSSSLEDQDPENVKTIDVGQSSCTFEELKKFDSFFSDFLNVAREFFLPSEKYRFGLVSESLLLSSLLVGDSGSWSVMLYCNGFPSSSKILKEGDDLKKFLLMDESVVTELEGNGQDLDLTIPANKPSVLLFVDRFSDSSETKNMSKEALDMLRKLALQHQISGQMGDKSERSFVQPFQEYKSISAHPRLKLSPMAQKIKLKEKMSVMIVNEGKHAILDNLASDLRGGSLHEILTYLLQQKKEAKLSSVAKDAGFHLLSDDMDIKPANELPLEPKLESTQVSALPSEEGFARTSNNLDEDFASNHKEGSQPTDIRYHSQDDEEKTTYVGTHRHLLSGKPDQLVSDDGVAVSEDVKTEERGSIQMDLSEKEEFNFQSFTGSFYFSDGNYRLLRVLTGETRIPSLLIIDPLAQQHYVFPKQMNFSHSSLEDFLDRFLNGNLIPYQHSDSTPENSREGIRPPFVNVDFHETDSIPRVTSQTFSEQVLGFNQSGKNNASHPWKEDVLVLFSNSWCGFCQRMELIVREVYRAIKGYMNMLNTGSRDGEILLKDDNLKNSILKLPKIFLMDCTLNDCSLILKSSNQRDVYPALLLFPAESKAPVSYEGEMAVADVIKFIADHGSSSRHLINNWGILRSVVEKRGRHHIKEALNIPTVKEASVRKDKSHEILLKNQNRKRRVVYSQIKSQFSKGKHERIPEVVIGSILVATEKLSVQPFDKSTVLIVKADQSTGFQGLIYNKPISWDSLEDLEQGPELLKEAPLSFGGPLIKRGMPLVGLTRRAIKGEFPEVAPGVYFLDQSATLNEIEQLKSGNRSIADYWFFLGFSSWSWDQLFDEIADGAWNFNVNNTNDTRHLDWPSSFV